MENRLLPALTVVTAVALIALENPPLLGHLNCSSRLTMTAVA